MKKWEWCALGILVLVLLVGLLGSFGFIGGRLVTMQTPTPLASPPAPAISLPAGYSLEVRPQAWVVTLPIETTKEEDLLTLGRVALEAPRDQLILGCFQFESGVLACPYTVLSTERTGTSASVR